MENTDVRFRGESAFSTALIVFFGYWVHQSLLLTSRRATVYDVGINFFPFVLSSGMLLLTVLVLVKGLLLSKPAENGASEPWSARQLVAPIALFVTVFATLLMYIALLRVLGFGFATLIFLLIMNTLIFRLTNGHFLNRKEFVKRLAGFSLFAFGMPFIFENIFRLMLP